MTLRCAGWSTGTWLGSALGALPRPCAAPPACCGAAAALSFAGAPAELEALFPPAEQPATVTTARAASAAATRGILVMVVGRGHPPMRSHPPGSWPYRDRLTWTGSGRVPRPARPARAAPGPVPA